MDNDWSAEVLRFWFEELPPEAWFRADPATDGAIRSRFLNLYRRLRDDPVETLATDPWHTLAAIVVLDQFSRNMFRNTPEAFAGDRQALALAKAAVAAGFDLQLTPAERQFVYMPFQHDEDPASQRRAVDLFTALGNAEALSYARHHKGIIDRFGRFPHRNAILGRRSTPDEIAFLKAEQPM